MKTQAEIDQWLANYKITNLSDYERDLAQRPIRGLSKKQKKARRTVNNRISQAKRRFLKKTADIPAANNEGDHPINVNSGQAPTRPISNGPIEVVVNNNNNADIATHNRRQPRQLLNNFNDSALSQRNPPLRDTNSSDCYPSHASFPKLVPDSPPILQRTLTPAAPAIDHMLPRRRPFAPLEALDSNEVDPNNNNNNDNTEISYKRMKLVSSIDESELVQLPPPSLYMCNDINMPSIGTLSSFFNGN